MNLDRLKIRPLINGLDSTRNKSVEEEFQNKTLRPVIKMQHDLLVEYFTDYLLSKKCKIKELTQLKQLEFINAAFQKDVAFRTEIKGVIIGQFTVEEFKTYNNHKRDYNKRILAMIQQRITSVLELF
jgi:hypothetical protein